jgi:hypothetical protein
MNEVDKGRLDERIEAHMQAFLKKIKETDSSFRVLQTQIRKPIEEVRETTEHHLFRISKSLLKPVDATKLRDRKPLATLYAKSESATHPIAGDSAALEIVKKMKREKALKIARAYRSYRLRQLVKRRAAARKVNRIGFETCRLQDGGRQ